MKKIILSLFLLLMAAVASAQFYVRANVGYNIPVNNDLIGQNYSYANADAGYVEKFKSVYGSYGAGTSIRAAVGGSLSNGIFGYDVEVGYLFGKQYTYTNSYQYSESEGSVKTTRSAKSFQISPSFTFTTGDGKFQPFARVGPVLAVSSIQQKQNTDSDYGTQKYSEVLQYKYSGGISVGFKGAIGVSYSIAPKMQLYAEVDFVSLSYSPSKRKTTKYDVNGQDSLGNIPDDQKEIDLKKEFETVSEEGEPPMRESYSMGSAGLQFGVKFTLK
ncbi:MAG TPA: hypothetical protein VIN08_22690 [Ohtaekwangia sp.]|uniref:hypothetical protein n=1 Tax=Ohtaekwangia sp. TaxID=2066019 RepID=UPI002F95A98B